MAVRVDHNYPDVDDLTIVDEDDNPIEGAQIRIFDHTAFHASEVDTWEAMTMTDINGHWVDPIYLEEARSWVVHIEKPTMYGPRHIEIDT
jgi:hypothetical protein